VLRNGSKEGEKIKTAFLAEEATWAAVERRERKIVANEGGGTSGNY